MKKMDDSHALCVFIGFALVLGGVVFDLVAFQIADEVWEVSYLHIVGALGMACGFMVMIVAGLSHYLQGRDK